MIEDISIDSNITRISNINKVILSNKYKENNFIKTGFNEGYSNIDLYLGGFELGNNVIIGARPGIGKTALALELCQRFFKYNPNREILILFFSWEMSKEQLYYRLLSSKLQTNILNIKNNYIRYRNNALYSSIFEELDKLNIFFIEGYNEVNMMYGLVKNTYERMIEENKDVNIICVYDHSRLAITKEKTTEEQRIFELLKTCNQIKKLNILNIILSQLNRDYEKTLTTKYHDPNNTHLFGADAIQQFSDVTLLLHNPYQYKCYEWECIDSENKHVNISTENKLFIHISKNRNGMSNFNLCIEYIKETQTFNNIKNKLKTDLFKEINNYDEHN